MTNFLIVVATVLVMELTAYSVHRWIMHGPLGWGWHKSHHEEHDHALEKNDLYGLVFAVIATVLFTVGWIWAPVLWWIALGMTVYGLIYFVLHDGLVHQRWPFRYVPRKGYAAACIRPTACTTRSRGATIASASASSMRPRSTS